MLSLLTMYLPFVASVGDLWRGIVWQIYTLALIVADCGFFVFIFFFSSSAMAC